MITILTLSALFASATLYLGLAWRNYKQAGTLSDHLPIDTKGNAAVRSSGEFSASTVATTVSLATVILAYTELASWFGLWLLWTVVTTVMGLLVVRWVAPKIWDRLQEYGDHRPSLHEFLGDAFGSKLLVRAASICTTLGFLGALAVELTVGSKFLAALAPALPIMPIVLVLAAIGVSYTVIGGFRTVIETDRIQMFAIWITLGVLTVVTLSQIMTDPGIETFAAQIPKSMIDFSWREGLGAFLIGIALLNIPTFVGDMGVWQRISGARDRSIVTKGLTRSALGAGFSWTTLALLACLIAIITNAEAGTNPLAVFLASLGNSTGILSIIAFLAVVFGLYAASLSTASTQLIAAGHTLHSDLLRGDSDKDKLASSKSELRLSRIVLFSVAAGAIIVVIGLQAAGFTIADLVFAVYGAQLALVPIVFLSLFASSSTTKAIGGAAGFAALAGFVAGWATAGYGKWAGDGNLVFLAPVASLLVSATICGLGYILKSGSKSH